MLALCSAQGLIPQNVLLELFLRKHSLEYVYGVQDHQALLWFQLDSLCPSSPHILLKLLTLLCLSVVVSGLHQFLAVIGFLGLP